MLREPAISSETTTRVCHISPVHPLHDNRIFYKELRSVRDAGYETHLVIKHDKDETIDGIHVHSIRQPKSRWLRWLTTGWVALFKALETKAKIYHFHDLEFIPQAVVMRLLGKRIVYDIHEDTTTSLAQKRYLPLALRKPMAWMFGWMETCCAASMKQIIAERCYGHRFPNATLVLNYPKHIPHTAKRSSTNLLYTGNVTVDRGAFVHGLIPKLMEDVDVYFEGCCLTPMQQQLSVALGESANRLHFSSIDEFLPFEKILETYQTGQWLAGLAIFPPTCNYQTKELTKLFEYMMFGLPIIASNFPVWKRLIEPADCGFCVDPENPAEIADAVQKLKNDPKLWKRMSDNGMQAAKNYTWESQAANMLQLYDRMLGSPESVDGTI